MGCTMSKSVTVVEMEQKPKDPPQEKENDQGADDGTGADSTPSASAKDGADDSWNGKSLLCKTGLVTEEINLFI